MKLNNKQDLVVKCKDKHILCIAGAGVGKTFTLLEKIKQEVSGGMDPESILVLTFTNAAASEMKHRYESSGHSAATPNFRTFHSFCYSLIVSDPNVRKSLNYAKVPYVAEDFQIKKKQKECEEQLGLKFPKGNKTLSLKESKDVEMLNKLLEDKLKKSNLITFDTLCYGVCKLFENDDNCIQKYKDKYKYILVDEFQDTDIKQWRFVSSFESANIFLCGDALQSIYAFRGGTSAIIKDLSTDPDWTTFKLTQNYRSKNNICEYANKHSLYAADSFRVAISSDMPGGEVHEGDVRYRRNRIVDDIFLSFCSGANDWEGTTAILCRTNYEAYVITEHFNEIGVSYYTKNSKSNAPKHILKSIESDSYMIDWLASSLNSSQYASFIRDMYESDMVSTHYMPDSFVKRWGNNDEIKKNFNIVNHIRKVLKDDNISIIGKWFEVWKSIGIQAPCMPEEVDEPNLLIQACLYELDSMGDPNSKVYVGTIHSAKGLEYDNVIVAGVEGPAFPLTDEENRNLFYVAITRAKNNLYVFRGA